MNSTAQPSPQSQQSSQCRSTIDSAEQTDHDMFDQIPSEVLFNIFISCAESEKGGTALGRALDCRKDWGVGVDKQMVWKSACLIFGWCDEICDDCDLPAVEGMERPAVSWSRLFKKKFCLRHDICMHCWKGGQGGHHGYSAGMRPLCLWFKPTGPVF